MFALAKKDNNQQIKPIIFNVGLYLRLSREDGDSEESDSITNQKDYLTRYVLAQEGWNLVDIFIDDGYTGTNFNRPDFIRLKSYIEDQRINLVITKDLSRLGRDYIDTGHYVERYFPEHNVRYIALNDGVDTFEANNSNNDMTPFKFVMNDFYARDISKKVRSTMNSKRKSGQFIGSFAPYGYLKDPTDKHKLIIDPQTSPIVKQIFDMYLAGSGYTHIAHTLNDLKIPSPGAYKSIRFARYKNAKIIMGLWTAATVKTIIRNPTYAGNLTQNKFAIVSYKVKKLKATPRESWLTVEGTHEPIVDEETFEAVQNLSSMKAQTITYSSKMEHLLGGLLYCKDCGSRMTFTKTQKGEWYCICSNYKRFRQCSRHSYLEGNLQQYIVDDLRRIAGSSLLDQEELLQEAQKEAGKRKADKANRTAKELAMVDKRLAEIKRIMQVLFEDKVKGTITERDFMDLNQTYNKERDELYLKQSRLSGQAPIEPQKGADRDLLKIVWNLIEFNKLSKLILSKLINKIEVSEDKTIDIYYTFKDSL